MDGVIFITAAAHLVYTPFTKVEESFNLQAMHDILFLRGNISQYDHHDYPGVVPRTFIGPLFISILSAPFVLLFEMLHINKFWAQYVVRLMLAAVISFAWNNLRNVLTKTFGVQVRLWFTVITLSQFHFMFYMTRPLPNIFALPIVLYALAYWFKGQTKPFIICSGIAVLVFRSELAIFLGLLLALDLLQRKISIEGLLKIAVPAAVITLVATVLVDSLFWQRLLWPEGEVLWFNTILNKSSNWGTSPFLWYFYSALPRALGASLLFIPIGLFLEPRIRPVVLAALGFVLIYSILPHKELRFIIYVFPVLNLSAACGCHRLWINSAKSFWQGVLALCAGGHLLINVLVTIFLLVVSGTNYPGGVALSRLHRLEHAATNVTVHIDNLAAQSGVSRFMEIRDDWTYSKDESMNYTQAETAQYTHLLVEAKSKHNVQLWSKLQEQYDVMEFVDCFNSIGIQYNSIMPVRVKTKPCIGILKRRRGAVVRGGVDWEPVVDEKTKKMKSKKEKTKSKKKTKMDEQPPTGVDSPIEEETTVLEEEISILDEEISTLPVEIPTLEEDLSPVDEATPILNAELPTVEETAEEDVVSSQVEPKEDEDDDGIVSNVESLETTESLETPNKEINFQELRNLALGQATRKTKATKLKIRKIIEQYYRSKGKQIENDVPDQLTPTRPEGHHGAMRQSVKSIIKQERIKEMIEQISTMDLTRICDLEKISTKDCLKQVIDKIDENRA